MADEVYEYKEFCWYDGDGNYVVMDANPEEMTKAEMIEEATRFLKNSGWLTEEGIKEQLTHCYVITYSKNIMEE